MRDRCPSLRWRPATRCRSTQSPRPWQSAEPGQGLSGSTGTQHRDSSELSDTLDVLDMSGSKKFNNSFLRKKIVKSKKMQTVKLSSKFWAWLLQFVFSQSVRVCLCMSLCQTIVRFPLWIILLKILFPSVICMHSALPSAQCPISTYRKMMISDF